MGAKLSYLVGWLGDGGKGGVLYWVVRQSHQVTPSKKDILRWKKDVIYSMKGVSLVYFSPWCLFKCVLKLSAREDA